jgi:hypothetical protein
MILFPHNGTITDYWEFSLAVTDPYISPTYLSHDDEKIDRSGRWGLCKDHQLVLILS